MTEGTLDKAWLDVKGRPGDQLSEGCVGGTRYITSGRGAGRAVSHVVRFETGTALQQQLDAVTAPGAHCLNQRRCHRWKRLGRNIKA